MDEEGRIQRINEGTYSQLLFNGSVGTEEYRPVVRDWVLKGENSPHVWSRDRVVSKIRQRSHDEALAEPIFKLGVHFFERGDELLARAYWERAQGLSPDSWNFHRQDWSFTADGSSGERFREKAKDTDLYDGEKYFYAPLEIQ